MQFLIDSNVLIDYLAARLPKSGMEFLNKIVDDVPYVSVISRIEVLGYESSEQDNLLIKSFMDECITIFLTHDIAENTIQIRKSTRIKTPDAIIAATAKTLDLILLTRNTNDFAGIAGIKVTNPWHL